MLVEIGKEGVDTLSKGAGRTSSSGPTSELASIGAVKFWRGPWSSFGWISWNDVGTEDIVGRVKPFFGGVFGL